MWNFDSGELLQKISVAEKGYAICVCWMKSGVDGAYDTFVFGTSSGTLLFYHKTLAGVSVLSPLDRVAFFITDLSADNC